MITQQQPILDRPAATELPAGAAPAIEPPPAADPGTPGPVLALPTSAPPAPSPAPGELESMTSEVAASTAEAATTEPDGGPVPTLLIPVVLVATGAAAWLAGGRLITIALTLLVAAIAASTGWWLGSTLLPPDDVGLAPALALAASAGAIGAGVGWLSLRMVAAVAFAATCGSLVIAATAGATVIPGLEIEVNDALVGSTGTDGPDSIGPGSADQNVVSTDTAARPSIARGTPAPDPAAWLRRRLGTMPGGSNAPAATENDASPDMPAEVDAAGAAIDAARARGIQELSGAVIDQLESEVGAGLGVEVDQARASVDSLRSSLDRELADAPAWTVSRILDLAWARSADGARGPLLLSMAGVAALGALAAGLVWPGGASRGATAGLGGALLLTGLTGLAATLGATAATSFLTDPARLAAVWTLLVPLGAVVQWRYRSRDAEERR